ncbi:single-stranded DNA-binding protein [Kitasatospora sp. NPDC058965]|uniref:single-stranded DNA-binding protein n=1 Tax=Kitasatospora sp. NPDC058965 TaxID=3346682 RepID=UPI00367FE466
MVNETMVTMIGNVASPVNYAQTASGIPMANFRLATTERRFDKALSQWVDGETNWVTVIAWRRLATNVVSSLSKGEPVVVSGRLRVREWEDEGKRRTTVEVDARVVGHDLGRGTSAFRWAVNARGDGEPQGAGISSAGEAVPEWIARAVREYRSSQVGGGAQEAVGAVELSAGPMAGGRPAGAADPVGAEVMPVGTVGVTAAAPPPGAGEPGAGPTVGRRRTTAARAAAPRTAPTRAPRSPRAARVAVGVAAAGGPAPGAVAAEAVEPAGRSQEEVVGAVLTG